MPLPEGADFPSQLRRPRSANRALCDAAADAVAVGVVANVSDVAAGVLRSC